MSRKIRIFCRTKTITLKGDKKETKDINEYSFTKDGETFYQIKFKQSVEKQPKTAGYYLLEVEDKDLSIQHTKPQEKFKPNDILWIGNVIDFVRDIDYEKELEKKQLEEIKLIFD